MQGLRRPVTSTTAVAPICSRDPRGTPSRSIPRVVMFSPIAPADTAKPWLCSVSISSPWMRWTWRRLGCDGPQPNLRKVHLIHGELIDTLQSQGFAVSAGAMGENITTRGIDMLGVPRGSRLHIGATAVV